jgi:hypothetical protein
LRLQRFHGFLDFWVFGFLRIKVPKNQVFEIPSNIEALELKHRILETLIPENPNLETLKTYFLGTKKSLKPETLIPRNL